MKGLDNQAADILPIRLIISISFIATFLVFLGIGLGNIKGVLEEQKLEQSCSIIKSKLYSLVTSGSARDLDDIDSQEGSKRMYSINLPDDIVFLAFGVDPDSKVNLTDDGCLIVYKLSNGFKKIIWLPEEIRLRAGVYNGREWMLSQRGFILDKNGVTTLIFELVEEDNIEYILIYPSE